MIRFVSLLLAGSVLISCASLRTADIVQSDSTRVEILETIKYRDSIIYVPIPEESDKAVLPPDDSSHLETSVAESDAYLRNGKLTHTLRNKHEAIKPVEIKIPEAKVQKAEVIYRDRVVEKLIEKTLTPWESFFISSGKIAVGLLLLWLLVAAGKKWL